MSQLTQHQQQALARACQVISPVRANEIRQLKDWQHGMCGCLNAVKPDAAPLTPEEDAAIRMLWDTLPGHTCWMTALLLLYNQSPKEYIP